MTHTEKYHLAIWALDAIGKPAHVDNLQLQLNWHWLAHFMGIDGIPEERKQKAMTEFVDKCDRIIAQHEADRHRSWSDKQRDYLLDVVARAVWATKRADCSRLLYWSPDREDFHAPELGTSYYLWQGVRAELKAGITLACIDPAVDPHALLVLSDRIKAVIWAMEHGRHEALPKYERSELHLSEEQYKKKLWEGVVQELRWILRDEKRAEAAQYFS